MAPKRFHDESGSDPNHQTEKRIRTRPSFASVIGEVVMVNSLQNLCSALEPVLRRVVGEEMERGLRQRSRSFTRSPSLRIQAPEPSSNLQFIFSKKLTLPIFTGSKILDEYNNQLQILVVEKTGVGSMVPVSLPHPIKVELVVVDGDFPFGGRDDWTNNDFESNIVKERTGRRPLLTGEVNMSIRDGVGTVGEIEFTDNSSWIRSRKFRIAAKVAAQGGLNIRQGMTEAFVVKDHRGELYKKHHPPMLEDDVWRLEKIGKDGAFHKKLTSENVKTVQDFLKLSVVNPGKLKRILGPGMSEKMWEVTIKHARECQLGNKFYVFRGENYTVILNSICQLIRAVIHGQLYPQKNMTNMVKAYIENLVKEAHANWCMVEEVEGALNGTALLTQDEIAEEYPNHNYEHDTTVKSFQQNGFDTDKSTGVSYIENDWAINPNYLNTNATTSSPLEFGLSFNINQPTSSDDFDTSPSKSFIKYH